MEDDSLTKNIKLIKIEEKFSKGNKSKKKEKEIKRNYGIDLLRIFSMINIIILHINLFGKQLDLNINNPKYKSIWFLETLAYWGVNGFGIISGIVGYKGYKFSNLIYIWIQYCFYSVLISLYLYNNNKMNLKSLILSFFPLLIVRNWYVNAYFCMYLLLPFINYGIMNLDRKIYKSIVLFFFLFYSVYNIIAIILIKKTNYHFLNSGYSAFWLIILYIIGGYYGKYILENKKTLSFLKNSFFIIILILIYLGSSFFSSEINFILLKKKSNINNKLFIDYLSPTILLQAISLIILFSRLNIKNKWIIKLISFFTPLTFNITLIHLRLFMEDIPIISKFFRYVNELNSHYIFFKIYSLGIMIYIICAIMDYFRLLLFNLLRIKTICIFIEKIYLLLLDKINF